MRNNFGLVALMTLLPSLALAGTVPADIGKTLYTSDCATCHTATGAGGVKFSGGAVSANLQAPHLEHLYHGSDALILRAILEAKDQNGERLDQPMPAWAGKLTKAQAKDILAYLKTLHG
jgi:mono/diheme cytochrome c family protein